MSGQQVTASGPLNATRRARAWLERLGVSPENVEQVRTLPVQRLIEAQAAEDPILGGGVYFGPVVDGRTMLRHPFYPGAHPQSLHIPMIIGNTHDETRAFLGGDPTNFTLTWDELPSRLTPQQMRIDVAPERVVAEYRRLYPHYSPSDVLFAATTAGRSWRAAIIEAEERARAGAPAWVYQLDWVSAREGGKFGAMHTADIPLVFDNIDRPGSTAEGPGAQMMADLMSKAFVSLARSGDPGTAALPTWARYELDRRQTMIFDTPPRMEDDPRGAERRFFAEVPYVQPGT
jgi:para-nitrobenzyl esterase